MQTAVVKSVFCVPMTEFDLTPCQLLLIERQELGNLRVPQCTEDGKFVPRQCDVRTGECWCVDVYGKKLDKTTHQGSNKLDCSTSGNFTFLFSLHIY